jgi:predicted nuclease of predicted toxin-antitoxin system
LRFFLDHDVDVAVGQMLRRHGHTVLTAAQAGLGAAGDDDITVKAFDWGGSVVTHDTEFSQRRRRHCIGWHLWLRCPKPDAAELLQENLEPVVEALQSRADIVVALSKHGLVPYPPKW